MELSYIDNESELFSKSAALMFSASAFTVYPSSSVYNMDAGNLLSK